MLTTRAGCATYVTVVDLLTVLVVSTLSSRYDKAVAIFKNPVVLSGLRTQHRWACVAKATAQRLQQHASGSWVLLNRFHCCNC